MDKLSHERYKLWISSDYFDKETKEELVMISNDERDIEERFYKELEFGTGGLRGKIGAGTNRMNKYVVRRTSQGLANYILNLKNTAKNKSVVIAYDSRHKSEEFAWEAARIFSANNIKTYLFDELRPVPILSFAVRYLEASVGIMITASHNPKEYNGYKVYGEDGAQIPLCVSTNILNEINKINDISKVNYLESDSKFQIVLIGKNIDDIYIESIKTLTINTNQIQEVANNYRIVYTPLHGTGNKPVRRILKETGFNSVLVVKEQELPDADFPTVKLPNPEEKSAFEMAIRLAKKENADLILGTDPDCDRTGVLAKNSLGEYEILTGNQIGCLLLNYLLENNTVNPHKSFIVQTIVTTDLTKKIADKFNIEFIEVLTGFKFIGEKINEVEDKSDKKFLLGFEESYGYLVGTFSRDKDGVLASMLIAEMAAYYKQKNMSLFDVMNNMFNEYGYYLEDLKAYVLDGKEGINRIQSTMEFLRDHKNYLYANLNVIAIRDYKLKVRYDINTQTESKLDLPLSDVLYYEMENGWFCVRPSGTEPKIKIYFGVNSKTLEETRKKLEKLKKGVLDVIEPVLKQE